MAQHWRRISGTTVSFFHCTMIRRRVPPGLQMLNERRLREEGMRFYDDAERSTSFIRQRADFETRSSLVFGSAEIKRQASLRQSHSEASLEVRRRRLSALLKSESDSYASELRPLYDTTASTRRRRLIDSLHTLHATRDAEHDEYVRERAAQGWRDACDPLRAEVSRAFERQVIAERDAQVIARTEGDADEAAYALQVRQNIEDLRADEERAVSDRRAKIELNRRTWLAQMQIHRDKEAAERERGGRRNAPQHGGDGARHGGFDKGKGSAAGGEAPRT
jgi:uncharacterized membrane protein YgcG